jgi:hypothetical protein
MSGSLILTYICGIVFGAVSPCRRHIPALYGEWYGIVPGSFANRDALTFHNMVDHFPALNAAVHSYSVSVVWVYIMLGAALIYMCAFFSLT